jgi:hypothetical protein
MRLDVSRRPATRLNPPFAGIISGKSLIDASAATLIAGTVMDDIGPGHDRPLRVSGSGGCGPGTIRQIWTTSTRSSSSAARRVSFSRLMSGSADLARFPRSGAAERRGIDRPVQRESHGRNLEGLAPVAIDSGSRSHAQTV